MTREQFVSKYRHHMLGFLSECWALRRLEPSSFGMEVDRQLGRIERMLDGMARDLIPDEKPLNGTPLPQRKVNHENGNATKLPVN